MTRPLVKPIRPEFSSGPCAKRPKWSLKSLNNSTLGRSHRHTIAKSKLQKVIDLTKSTLNLPVIGTQAAHQFLIESALSLQN